MYLKVLKLDMHVHIQYRINKNNKILKLILISLGGRRPPPPPPIGTTENAFKLKMFAGYWNVIDFESKCCNLNSRNQQPIELGGGGGGESALYLYNQSFHSSIFFISYIFKLFLFPYYLIQDEFKDLGGIYPPPPPTQLGSNCFHFPLRRRHCRDQKDRQGPTLSNT